MNEIDNLDIEDLDKGEFCTISAGGKPVIVFWSKSPELAESAAELLLNLLADGSLSVKESNNDS